MYLCGKLLRWSLNVARFSIDCNSFRRAFHSATAQHSQDDASRAVVGRISRKFNGFLSECTSARRCRCRGGSPWARLECFSSPYKRLWSRSSRALLLLQARVGKPQRLSKADLWLWLLQWHIILATWSCSLSRANESVWVKFPYTAEAYSKVDLIPATYICLRKNDLYR